MRTAQFLLLLSIIIYLLLLGTAYGQGLDWQQTGGPTGGNINSLGKSSNGNLIAVSAGGIYKSGDNGNNWQRGNYSLENITTEIVSTVNGYTVFANDGNVFRSTDNGDTWSATGVTGSQVRHLSTNSAGYLFLTADEKLYVSANNGNSWSTNTEPKPFNFIYGIASPGTDLFIAANNGVYHSVNYGQSWINITGNLPEGPCYSILVKDGKIYAGKYRSIYYSADGGTTWIQGSADFTEQAGSLSFDSAGNVYASTGNILLKSADDGNTWSKLKEFTFPLGVQGSLVFLQDGTAFAASYNCVLRFTDNFNTVEELSNGMINTVTYDIAATSNGKVFAIGDFDVFSTSDNGGAWLATNAKSVFGVYPNHRLGIDKNDNVYVGYTSGYGKSSDYGATWTKHLVDGSSSELKSFAFGNNGIMFALGNTDVFRSTNNGFTWQSVETFPNDISDSRIVTDRFGYVYYPRADGIYRSVNDGITWHKFTPVDKVGITDFIITRKGYFVVGTTTGLFVSTNGGAGWTPVTLGSYGQSHIYTLFEAPNGELLTTTTYGLFSSLTNGLSWNYIDDTATRGFAASYFRTDNDGYLYSSSNGKGVFRTLTPFIKIPAPVPTALAGSEKAYIRWNKNTSVDFKEYRIYGSYAHYPTAIVYTAAGGINDTTAILPGLINGTSYYIVVSAVDNQGNETFSDEISVVPVPAPSAPELVSVADQSVNISASTLLKWRKSPGALTYHLQLSGDSTFVNLVIDSLNLQDTLIQAGNLSYLTKYFWRVSAKGDVEEGSWSGVWSFTTGVQLPDAPALLIPADSAVNVPVEQVFKWSSSATAIQYHFQLSEDSAFTNFIVNDSGITDTTLSRTLNNNTKYHWRVSAINPDGASPWQQAYTFTTIIAAPDAVAPVYPAASSVNVPRNFNFVWLKSERAETYFLQLSADSLFAATILSDSTITDTTYNVDSLNFSTKYFWRLKAKNIGGETGWSAVHSFTTIAETPGVILLSAPANLSNHLPTEQLFVWLSSSAADHYQLQITNTAEFGNNPPVNDSALTDTSKLISGLLNNVDYFWRVRGINNGVAGQWSDVWLFRTIVALPVVPVLSSPANNSVKQLKDITITWNAVPDAEFYRLQLFTDAALTTKVYEDSVLTTSSKQMAALVSGTKYYWRVNAKNYAGTGSYSAVWNFTTLLEAPEITAETYGIEKNRVILTNKSNAAPGYIVERNTEGGASYTLLDTVKAGETSFVDSTALSAVTYKYRAKAFTNYAVSDYSSEATVTTITDVNSRGLIPTEYSISQNYPNPFNPSTMIEYSLPYESSVKITIYNSLGELVTELTNGIIPAGYNHINFNAVALASGIYFCVINAQSTDGKNNFHSTKKMMMLK